MLYIGSDEALPALSTQDIKVERVDPAREVVRQWFSQPVVQFIGAHTGCSCGFPSIMAETPLEYYEGMPLHSDDRVADLKSVRALIELLEQACARSGRVELYPVADGDESKAPKGAIEWQLEALDFDRLFFNERFMHVVHSRALASDSSS